MTLAKLTSCVVSCNRQCGELRPLTPPADAQRGGFPYARSGVPMVFSRNRNTPEPEPEPKPEPTPLATVHECDLALWMLSVALEFYKGNRGQANQIRAEIELIQDRREVLEVRRLIALQNATPKNLPKFGNLQ